MGTNNGHEEFWRRVIDYDNQIFSVFADREAENPIFDYLASKSKNLTVADLGCGPGNFLRFLADHFRQVIAVDYSETLLNTAKNRNSDRNNIDYIKADMRDLSRLHDSLDVAISVNSLLPENISDLNMMVEQAYKCIKAGGEFVGILPSADVVTHMALLDYEATRETGITEKEFEEKFTERHNTSILGFHRDSPDDPIQKYWFPFEISWRFEKAGFKEVSLQKSYYSWEYCRDHKYGHHPDKERIWDWFVTAKK